MRHKIFVAAEGETLERVDGFHNLPGEGVKEGMMKKMPKAKALCGMTETRAREKGITYSEALTQIVRENPTLAAEYRREVLDGNPSGRPAGTDPASTMRRLVEWAKQRGMEKGVTFQVALGEIVKESPELYHAYREAVTGKKI